MFVDCMLFRRLFQMKLHGSDYVHSIKQRFARKDNIRRTSYRDDRYAPKFGELLEKHNIAVGACWGKGFTNCKSESYEGAFTMKVKAFAEQFPDTPIVVFCSGNDIYWDDKIAEVILASKHGISNCRITCRITCRTAFEWWLDGNSETLPRRVYHTSGGAQALNQLRNCVRDL